jgi:hypothetical protein
MPRTSGMLSIGFSADQFSDDAIGDVWEGTRPSSIGVLRERQLASVLLGNERPEQFPSTLISELNVTSEHLSSDLESFLIVESGKINLKGKFSSTTTLDPRLMPLKNLRDMAIIFIAKECPKKASVTECKSRMLGNNLMEWVVSWKAATDGSIEAIELLHEVNMSSTGKNWNVLFAK